MDGADPARVTFMASGGSLKANIDRWIGQFNEGAKTNQEQFEADGKQVHLVEIKGTYRETMGGPFSGGKVVEQPNYGMLGGIIVDPEGAQYFAKMVGTEATIEAQKESFKKMLKSVNAK